MVKERYGESKIKKIENIMPKDQEQQARLFRIMLLHGMLVSSMYDGEEPPEKPFIYESPERTEDIADDVLHFWEQHKYVPSTGIMIDGLARFAAESIYAAKDKTPDTELLEEKVLALSLRIVHKTERQYRHRSSSAVWSRALQQRYAAHKEAVWQEQEQEHSEYI